MNSAPQSPFVWLPRTPFGSLVAYFVKRIFASEDEQNDEEISLGLGVVVALLASPGAFASLFLLDKYSTLLQWIRGQRHFDFLRASAGDEYFFVVLSMTITGLVMLMRWNKLFPDRRDFANLAPLPIPIHHIFLSEFCSAQWFSASVCHRREYGFLPLLPGVCYRERGRSALCWAWAGLT